MKNFVETTALGQHQEKGFPRDRLDAVCDLTTRADRPANRRLGLCGLTARSKRQVITKPQVPHTTYSTHLGGFGYLRGLERPVPREVMFPDFFARRRAEAKAPLSDDRSFSLSNVHQVANQQ
jgi:hypothetical protein